MIETARGVVATDGIPASEESLALRRSCTGGTTAHAFDATAAGGLLVTRDVVFVAPLSTVRRVASRGEGLSAVIVVCDRGCVTTATQALGDQPPSRKLGLGREGCGHEVGRCRYLENALPKSRMNFASPDMRSAGRRSREPREQVVSGLPGRLPPSRDIPIAQAQSLSIFVPPGERTYQAPPYALLPWP